MQDPPALNADAESATTPAPEDAPASAPEPPALNAEAASATAPAPAATTAPEPPARE